MHVAARYVTRFESAGREQRAWAAAALETVGAGGCTGAGVAAWLLSPAAPPPVDAVLALLQAVLGVGAQLARTARQRTLATNGSLLPAEAVAFDEGDAAVRDGLLFLARAGALLAHARLSCTADVYCAAAEAVLQHCRAYAADTCAAYERRRTWTAAALQAAQAQAGAECGAQRWVFTADGADTSLHLFTLLRGANVPVA